MPGCPIICSLPAPPSVALADAPTAVREGLQRESGGLPLGERVVQWNGTASYCSYYTDETGRWDVGVDGCGRLIGKATTLRFNQLPAPVASTFTRELGHEPLYIGYVITPGRTLYEVEETRPGPRGAIISVKVAEDGRLIRYRCEMTIDHAPTAIQESITRVLGVAASPTQYVIMVRSDDGVRYIVPRVGPEYGVRQLVFDPSGTLLSDSVVDGSVIDRY
jgi:hypothetical protein